MRTIVNHWEPMRTIENLWEPLRTFENLWEPLRTFENYWEPLRTFENYWEPLRTFENYWEPLRTYDNSANHLELLKPLRTMENHKEPIRPWLVIYLFPVPWFAINPCGRADIFYYCINNIIILLLLAGIQFSNFEHDFACKNLTTPQTRLELRGVANETANNKWGCGCQNSKRAGDGKLVYYKWWP